MLAAPEARVPVRYRRTRRLANSLMRRESPTGRSSLRGKACFCKSFSSMGLKLSPLLRTPDFVKTAPAQQSRSFWLKQLHQWHWISAAISLVGLLLFAVTGFTLNHAGQIEAKPKVVDRKATLPADLLADLAKGPTEGKRPLPIRVETWLDKAVDADIARREGEWSQEEVYVALARPGGDAWISIDRATGAVEHEKTTRGAVSLLNDLHKGRNAGKA